MALYQKCIPHAYAASIFDIDYKELKKQGIRALFFDLDNTIIAYDDIELDQQHRALLDALKRDFDVVVLSNTSYKRVSLALKQIDVFFIWHATKPLKRGFRKACQNIQVKPKDVVMIGDQLMTDILGANRLGMKTILVRSVKRKSDRWMTKINRRFEVGVLKKIQKKQPELYLERLKTYVDDHQM
jgi:hypothetical protein